MFRKEFALLGVMFGCFFFASLAFPGGVVESTANGTANIPSVQSVGGWGGFGTLLLVFGGAMLGTITIVSIGLMVVRRKNLDEVAEAFEVPVEMIEGMTPMQAADALTLRNKNSRIRKYL